MIEGKLLSATTEVSQIKRQSYSILQQLSLTTTAVIFTLKLLLQMIVYLVVNILNQVVKQGTWSLRFL